MTDDQRIEAENDFDAAWDEEAATPVDEQDAVTEEQDQTDDEFEVEDQTPDDDQASSDDVADDDQDDELAKAEQRWKSTEGRLKHLEKQAEQYREELERLRASKQPAATPDDQAKDEQPRSDGKPKHMTEEEWAEFQTDFPDLAKAFKAQADEVSEVRNAVGDMKAQREKEQQQAREAAEQEALEAHNKAIRKAHSDYDDICQNIDDVMAFVETQSPLLQRAYRAAIEGGSATEIIELLDAYKAAKAPQSDPTPSTPTKKPSLAVKTRKSRPNLASGKGAEDFDGAFDEAVAKG